MTETKEPAPLEIVDGAFEVPLVALTDTLYARFSERDGLYIDTDTDGTVAIFAPADIPRFIDALCRLTGNGPIRAARLATLREAAAEVDCGCSARDAVLAAKTKADRWRACGEANCGALMARDILSLAEKE